MVTKWKKSNISLVAAYVLGISFLIAGSLGILEQTGIYGNRNAWKEAVSSSDYQKTEEFRDLIARRLMNFLRMANEEYVSDYGYYNTYYSTAHEDATVIEAEEENVAEAVAEEAEEGYWPEQGFYDSSEPDYLTRDEKKASAVAYHKHIKEDKNLIYRIVKDGKVLYANTDGLGWDYSERNLPKDYNFFLRFDGKKTEIQKDGKKLDIYGDGVYRESEDWYVPGFKNLPSSSKWENVTILILAAEKPALYLGSEDGYYDYYYYTGSQTWNDLYYIYQDHADRRESMQRSIAFFVAGLLALVLYRIVRKEKRFAGKQMAKLTAKLWFEWKVLLFLVLPAVLFFIFVLNQADGESSVAYAEVLYQEDLPTSIFVSELSDYLILDLASHTMWCILIFWLFYLFVCDLRNNRGSCKKGFFGKFADILISQNINLPLAKKMVRRSYGVFFVTAAQLVLVLVLLVWDVIFGKIHLVSTNGWEYSYGTGVPVSVLIAVSILTAALLFAEYRFQKKNWQLALDLERLSEQISGIRDGNYDVTEMCLAKDADVRHMETELEEIRQGFEHAVEERTHSERMKVELVANVSHDIKTPLTSIISYIQLLKQEEGLPDYVRDYVRILDEKSERLKTMVQDVFSVSKAASGQLEVELEVLDLGKLLYQTLADMDEVIQNSPIALRTEIPKEPVLVQADGQRMYRVFQNLIGNAVKYSLEGSRVYVTLEEKGELAVASVKNTSSRELTGEVDFAERFVRGDESRTDGGSGLGLSIAKSFTEACGGTFSIESIADLFVVTISFGTVRREDGE